MTDSDLIFASIEKLEDEISESRKQLSTDCSTSSLTKSLTFLENKLGRCVEKTDAAESYRHLLDGAISTLEKSFVDQPEEANDSMVYNQILGMVNYCHNVCIESRNAATCQLAVRLYATAPSPHSLVVQIHLDASGPPAYPIQQVVAGNKKMNKKIAESTQLQELIGSHNLDMLCFHLQTLVDSM